MFFFIILFSTLLTIKESTWTLVSLVFQLSNTQPVPKQSNLAAAAAQHCVGADVTEAICESSKLSAAAAFYR
jgi:hypothetical protein